MSSLIAAKTTENCSSYFRSSASILRPNRGSCPSSDELNECAHNGDVYFNGAGAAQHAGKHRDALLGECVRTVSPAAAPSFEITNCDLKGARRPFSLLKSQS